jgi:hypothetical protein
MRSHFRYRFARTLRQYYPRFDDRGDNMESMKTRRRDMARDIFNLRAANHLEVLFYRELSAPLNALVATHSSDPARAEEIKFATQRFKKEIARFGFLFTDSGVMVQVEPDIISTRLDAADQTLLSLDMQVLNRLTNKR